MRQARPWVHFPSPSRYAARFAKTPGMLPGALLWYEPWRISRTGLILVVAAHLALLWALTRISAPSALPLLPVAPVLSVDLLMPSVSVAPPQKIEVPDEPVVRPPVVRPTPVRQPAPPAPVLTTSATTAMEAAPPIEPPSPAAEEPQPAETAPPPAAAPQPPRFDAAYLDNPRPVYPTLSRRMGEQGTVQLRVQVDANGQPLDVKLHSSSGSPRLDNTAIEAVRRWRFVPARLGNKPVAASVIVPIVFSLKD
ncbi:putative TonB protein [Sterolibacterium denitrificans]|uniref:TonB protein n=2 Tax=Sterolibacterium denitrificans TaxID=157592 RepID=A0A7Z7MW55_9PROT|nr:energy transducer TonB [Sterolibacterium denitrificans]SMB31127.1 putative TonB protein [Sterolibacterium denitrificans]